jgi:hypothetical protein
MKPEILERQIARTGYVTVERLRMRLTDGAEVSREVERHGDAAAVLPYDVERRSALVVRLFRAPVLVEAASRQMPVDRLETEGQHQPPAAGRAFEAPDALAKLLACSCPWQRARRMVCSIFVLMMRRESIGSLMEGEGQKG